MPPRFDSFPSSWSSELTHDAPRAAPGKNALTQRMTRATPAPSPAAADADAPVQRHLDPAAAAVQRAQQEHDLAAALGFLGGPAASIDESLALQKQSTDAHTGLTDEQVSAAAAAGVGGAGQALPHLDAIQRSFGAHDVSGVRAHVGGAAADASHAIGASAYATGNDVAFAAQPDLFLAAHEAAHVVQQRQGVHLKGAVGQDGDAYERHADDVAAAVVRGESAESLLGAPGGAAGTAVQRATTYTAALQNLGSVTLDGSVYLGETPSGPYSYENPFGGKTKSSVQLGEEFHGVLRVHLTGNARSTWAALGLKQVDLDLIAVWNADYADNELALDFDRTLLQKTRYPLRALGGEISLDVEHDADPKTFYGHPGRVTLTITPRWTNFLGDFNIGIGPIGVNPGDNELAPLIYEIELYSKGEDPIKKKREADKEKDKPKDPPKPAPEPSEPIVPAPTYAPHTVLFPNGKAVPTGKEFTELTDWAAKMKALLGPREREHLEKGEWEIEIMAGTSTDGSEAANTALAKERYLVVHDILSGKIPLDHVEMDLRPEDGPGARHRYATATIRLGPAQQAKQDQRDIAEQNRTGGGDVHRAPAD